MYAFIRGLVDHIDYERNICILDTGGVGYNISLSSRDIDSLPGLGQEIRINTYTAVRENEIALYGFLSRDDLEMFILLISISGVGPKAALSILSEMDADSVRFAILTGDQKSVSKAPGIGAKTAQRILLELKDKVESFGSRSASDAYEGAVPAAQSKGDSSLSDAKNDAIAALTALGYSNAESRKAVAAVEETEGMDSGAIMSEALKLLYR